MHCKMLTVMSLSRDEYRLCTTEMNLGSRLNLRVDTLVMDHEYLFIVKTKTKSLGGSQPEVNRKSHGQKYRNININISLLNHY